MSDVTRIIIPADPDAPFDPPEGEWYAAWNPAPGYEGGPWGVYDDACVKCGMPIMHVAHVDDVNNGTVPADGPTLCQFCEDPSSLN